MDQDIGMHSPVEDLEWPILKALGSLLGYLIEGQHFTLVPMEEICFAHVFSPFI